MQNKIIKIALVGQPNVGKSMLINSISNAKLRVGNFSGVTVAKEEVFLEYKKTKLYAIKLIPFIKGSMNFFNNYTNVELENDLIIADVYDLGEENLKYGMYLFTDLFWDKIKKDRTIKKTIYLDEIWRLIGVTSNKDVASFIYKIFKTIKS